MCTVGELDDKIYLAGQFSGPRAQPVGMGK